MAISAERQFQYFYRIYEQIYFNSVVQHYEIQRNTGISRNTVSKYLKKMYEQQILQGPSLRIRPAQNYNEYVYLMRFKSPGMVLQGLRDFPHVVYCALLFGRWNILVITDMLFDLSDLVGLQEIVYQGERGISETPKVNLVPWKTSVHKAEDYLKTVELQLPEERKVEHFLPWEEQEWKLFSAFHDSLRENKTPILQKIEVRYNTYSAWKKELDTYCTRHVGFYPYGYGAYDHHCFLVSTDFNPQIKNLFSLFPTTPFFMEVENDLLIIISLPNPEVTRWLYCIIDIMKTKEMITKCWHAQFLLHKNLRGHINTYRGIP